MSDDTSKNESLPQYEPQPRGVARIQGIDTEAVDKRLAECSDFFLKHCDETDYRNLDWYLGRMQLKFAVGDDIYEVVDDAFMAARCLHDRHAMHLELKPPEMFATRRVTPVELGILSGMPMLTLEFAATYGLPLMMVIGNTAPEDIMSEANLMTSYFRRGFCADFVELTGLSAVIYAGVIAAIGRGFDDEAMIGLNVYATARDSLRGMPPKALLNKLKRYDALNTALACLCSGNFDAIGEILAPEADAFAADQARRAGDDWLAPSKMPPPKYFDTAILTILALSVLRGHVPVLPQTGAIAAYGDFLRGLTEMPERRIEMPALDEESRRILQEAGIDPNNLGVDDSFQDEKEASEARAAALFEERQKAAQEAVRAKIAQGIADDEDHASVNPDNLEQEKLRLSDSESNAEDSSRKSKDFSNFFANDSQEDNAVRNAFDEENEVQKSEGKNYGAFFEQNDIPDNNLEEHETHEPVSKDFSSFFSQDNEEDQSLRDNVENENRPVEESSDKSKDFSSFFNNDDSDDSSIRSHLDDESAQAEDSGRNYNSFFDNTDENSTPKFDDGSDEDDRQTRSFNSDFFSSETKSSFGLKMELEPEPEPEPVKEPEKTVQPVVSEPYVSEIEDNSPKRDFSKFFEESEQTVSSDLKMSLDEESDKTEVKCVDAVKPAVQSVENETRSVDEPEQSASGRDFSKFFEESEQTVSSDLKMSLDDAEHEATIQAANAALQAPKTAEAEPVVEESLEEAHEHRDFSKFFEEADERELYNQRESESVLESESRDFNSFFDHDDRDNVAEEDRDAQLRELEAEQLRKAEEAAQKQVLKLELDGSEDEDVKAAESYQARMTRLIAEKQAAAREQALREREEAERELEELKKNGVARPVVEELQLKPTESTDPDEQVQKVAPEDLVIKGFAYDDLDMIHANTAVREDVEEDFDMHAAVAQKQFEEAQKQSDKNISAEHHDENTQDDDLLKW